MNTPTVTEAEPLAAVREYREQLANVRSRARRLFDGGATGLQVTAALSEGIDWFVGDRFRAALQGVDEATQAMLARTSAVIAIGGTGRGDPAPFSDVDLLLLYDGPAKTDFETVTSQFVRDLWDAGISLGHAVRTVGDTLALAKQESEVATALIHRRLLWGSPELLAKLEREFQRQIIRNRARSFILDCITSREDERRQHGGSATQLEPDLKKSYGGLRDVHLIRWIGFAEYGTADIESLRLKGALAKKDARRLQTAQEYLMRIRCDLHFEAGKPQDVLNRDEQLRLSEKSPFETPVGQRPVEAYMQRYFKHSTTIAQIARRFIALHRPKSLGSKMLGMVASRRVNGSVVVRPDGLHVRGDRLDELCEDIESILRLYRSAAWQQADLAPAVVEAITLAEPELDADVSEDAAKLFLDLLKRPGHVGAVLRGMHETAILELIIPNMGHARCLLQFNQYHHYTVDEHTFRAIEACEAFETDDGPLGTAYRAVKHKEILHLALLLHDLGKGFEEDHSDVGAAIAETIARRLFLPDHHRETLVYLVHQHLKMSHLAFRRDCSDPDILMEFAREVGSPETLRMLYVLTAADITGVGPDVFNDWKAELLTDLYERAMLIVSGKPYRHHEERRIAGIKAEVQKRVTESDPAVPASWISQQLAAFPVHYLSTTTAGRIADDLRVLRSLQPGEVDVEAWTDLENGTVDYRVVLDASMAKGCFHRIAGALTAKRMEILEAHICTTTNGTAVDRFRVIDTDCPGEVPPERIAEVAKSIREAQIPGTSVAGMFRKFQRFGDAKPVEPVSDLKTRVVIDNDSSEQCTVIDVFAHDRRGLLYTLGRELNRMNVSVELAKISTHLDQVVDVFYITDENNQRIRDGERLKEIRTRLLELANDFESNGYRRFLT